MNIKSTITLLRTLVPIGLVSLLGSLLTTACSASSLIDDQGQGDAEIAAIEQGSADSTTPVTLAEDQTVIAPEWSKQTYNLATIASSDEAIAMATRFGTDDLWVAERGGKVRLLQRRVSLDGSWEGVKLMNTVVLDLSKEVSTKGEGGLLGLDFTIDGRFLYVSYTDKQQNTIIAEYEMGILSAKPETERILLSVKQPAMNHNGGQITIGPDGFLYIALGDGGYANDPDNNGQNLGTMLGSILRIDPLAPTDVKPYGIPTSNPYLRNPSALNEIWLNGVRNPWRFSFDRITGDMWIGDVGQDAFEEITMLANGTLPAGVGANLGWPLMEGPQRSNHPAFAKSAEPPSNYVSPIHSYQRDNGRCAIIGGYVYRGRAIDALNGVYLFADYCSGELWGIEPLINGKLAVAPIDFGDQKLGPIISFGQDTDGELYLFQADGTIMRLQHEHWYRDLQVIESDQSFPGGQVLPEEILPATEQLN